MITGILLAAGAGTRFGGNKLLAPLRCGTPIGIKAARNLLSAVDQGIAVVRPSDQRLAKLLKKEGFQVAYCPNADNGMGASLAFGVNAAQDSHGWLIALADMPFIQPDTIRHIANLIRAGAPIAAPRHQSVQGHPVGFAREFFNGLTQLSGDRGAHPLLTANAGRIESFDCEDLGIFADIDTRSDHAMAYDV